MTAQSGLEAMLLQSVSRTSRVSLLCIGREAESTKQRLPKEAQILLKRVAGISAVH